MRSIVRALCVFVISLSAFAGGLASLTNSQATGGLRQALDQGARAAVDQLGQSGGFLNNPKVRIPLPSVLEQTRSVLKFMGKGDDLEALETTMNRAAEAAVPEARNLLVAAVKQMSVQDAKNILAGGDDSVTRYFEEKTRAALTTRFFPLVTKQTDRLALSGQYNALAGKAAGAGLLKGDEVSVERYVTAKALDGLYWMIGEEEKKIRRDPVGTGSALLKKVFGL